MADKCKKKTSTLDVCDDMQVALSHGLLVRQTLHNRITRTKRERIVLHGKAGDMGIIYCPFCRIDIAIHAKKETP